MGFSASQLASLQRAAEFFFDSTCNITNPGTGSDGMGGTVETSTVAGPQNVPCLARQKKREPVSGLEGGAQEERKRFEVLLKLGTAVSVKSRLTVTGPAPSSLVEIYEVIGHDVGRSNAQTVLCDCVRFNDGGA